MKKQIMTMLTVVGIMGLSLPAQADDQMTTPMQYQSNGSASFVGTYEYPDDDTTPNADTTHNTVFQPTDKTNPYYGTANMKDGQAVLPNTGAPTTLEQFGTPIALLMLAMYLFLGHAKKHASN